MKQIFTFCALMLCMCMCAGAFPAPSTLSPSGVSYAIAPHALTAADASTPVLLLAPAPAYVHPASVSGVRFLRTIAGSLLGIAAAYALYLSLAGHRLPRSNWRTQSRI